MTPFQPLLQSAKSISDLETENAVLQARLSKAQETIQKLLGTANANGSAETTLRRSEARLEAELADTKLLQGISARLITETVDTLYMEITEAALAIMQSDFASMQMYYAGPGDTTGELRLLASSGLSQEGKDFWARVGPDAGTTCAVAMRTGKRFVASDMSTCEFVVNTPDHEMFARAGVRAAQSTPLHSRSGKLLGMISTHWTHNHTPSDRDLNLLDILARQAADLIERNIAQDALQQSKMALIEADRRKDEFLATLAHELRNPLSPIRNALQIMRTQNPDNAQELLAMMDRQVAHLVRLIDDLLDISRVSQGKIDLRRTRITLQSALREAMEASQPLMDERGHKLTLDVAEAPLWIDADLTRLSQIAGNLLNNAAKYTPPGGDITVSIHDEEGHAVLSVSDTGVGISDDMLLKVFDLFAQVDRNLEQSQGGLGIGLALVKQLVEMHDGKIEARSPGLKQGSTFTVRLPLAPFVAAGLEENDALPAPAEMAQAAALRVLVIDDNIASAETTGWMLEMGGHETKLAHKGTDALAAADSFHPDAILLDIGLPGMNGYDVCRELRKDPRFRDTLIIAQTGWGQDRDRQLAKEAGFDHHLVKPLNLQQLTKLLAGASA